MGSARGPFGVRAGSVRGSREVRSGSVRDCSGSVQPGSGSVRGPFGVRAGSVWGPHGVCLGSVELITIGILPMYLSWNLLNFRIAIRGKKPPHPLHARTPRPGHDSSFTKAFNLLQLCVFTSILCQNCYLLVAVSAWKSRQVENNW